MEESPILYSLLRGFPVPTRKLKKTEILKTDVIVPQTIRQHFKKWRILKALLYTFFDRPFSNFCQKRHRVNKKDTASKKVIFGTKFPIFAKKKHFGTKFVISVKKAEKQKKWKKLSKKGTSSKTLQGVYLIQVTFPKKAWTLKKYTMNGRI